MSLLSRVIFILNRKGHHMYGLSYERNSLSQIFTLSCLPSIWFPFQMLHTLWKTDKSHGKTYINDKQINQMGIHTLMTQINQSKHLERPLESNDSIINRNAKQLLQLCKYPGSVHYLWWKERWLWVDSPTAPLSAVV